MAENEIQPKTIENSSYVSLQKTPYSQPFRWLPPRARRHRNHLLALGRSTAAGLSSRRCGICKRQTQILRYKVTQTAWGDYWTTLSTGFVSGTAPDVFTNHLARYPEFVANDLLVDIAPLIKQDNVPTDIYLGGLLRTLG